MDVLLLTEMTASPLGAVQNAMVSPEVIHFAPLLQVAAIQNLATSSPDIFKALNVFAFGTMDDLPVEFPLDDACWKKLRQLSIITYATTRRDLEYDFLIEKLRLSNVRELEELLIDSINHGFVTGKLDSKRCIVQIDDWTPRDVSAEYLPNISESLQSWLSNARSVIFDMDEKANKAEREVMEEQQVVKNNETHVEEARSKLEESLTRERDFEPTGRPKRSRQSVPGFRTKK